MVQRSVDRSRVAVTPEHPTESSSLATVDSGAVAREREDRRLAIKRVVWIAGVIAWPLFGITDYIDASNSPRPNILGTLLWLRFAGWLISGVLLLVLRKPDRSDRVLAACDVLGFGTYSFLTAAGAVVMGGFGVNVCLGIMIVAFLRATLLPSHWARAFIVATFTMLLLPATVLGGTLFDPRVAEAWLGPGRVGPLIYSLGVIMAGIAVGSAGCHMAWRARRKVFATRQLGKYRLKARIGSGATGDVWLARQELLGRDVAVKILRNAESDEGGELRRRFAREAKAASLLRHPNTIRVIEYGVGEDGYCFIAMELLDGFDLQTLVEHEGPLPPWRAIHLAIQACGSLGEAHELGIVHRDIKPANLFVTSVGEDEDFVKLLDFGIARMAAEGGEGAGMTKVGAVFGTPAYMAPEACRGEPADARTDLYSLGGVLYFMLTGREVFRGKSAADTLLAQLKQEPQPPSAHAPSHDLPKDLEAIVMRCLSKDRDNRFQSARELEEALRACVEFRPGAGHVAESATLHRKGLSELPPAHAQGSDATPEPIASESSGAKPPSRRPLAANLSELEERRRALLRVAWIACLIAWPFFIVTDVIDAILSHQVAVLPTLLALRLACVLVSVVLIAYVRRSGIPARLLALCDVLAFTSFAFFVSLEAVLLPGFEERAVLGIMIVAFMRAALVPSRWSRAFAIAALSAAVYPATLLILGLADAQLGRVWLAQAGNLAYALGQILAASAMGAVASQMTWRAERQVLEARKLGQYRLKARLGSGATGDVWLARQDALDRDVALKVLRTRGDEDDESLRRFAREAKAASALRHPNTIRVIEYGASDDGVYFIAMELLHGIELEKLVRGNGPMEASLAIHLALQACGSLSEAHEAGIVHRDIKPANLFVTRVASDRYFLKLLDFGIAQVIEGDQASTVTQGEGIFGTPAYMSPEACCGEPTDARSDIYSLGAVIYFMLSGTEVFPGQTFAQTLVSHIQAPPEPLSVRLQTAGRTVPEDLESVVLRCLNKRAEERFSSSRELEKALRGCADCREDAPRPAWAA